MSHSKDTQSLSSEIGRLRERERELIGLLRLVCCSAAAIPLSLLGDIADAIAAFDAREGKAVVP